MLYLKYHSHIINKWEGSIAMLRTIYSKFELKTINSYDVNTSLLTEALCVVLLYVDTFFTFSCISVCFWIHVDDTMGKSHLSYDENTGRGRCFLSGQYFVKNILHFFIYWIIPIQDKCYGYQGYDHNPSYWLIYLFMVHLMVMLVHHTV